MSHPPARRRDIAHEVGHVLASVHYQRSTRHTTAAAAVVGTFTCALTGATVLVLSALVGQVADTAGRGDLACPTVLAVSD